MTDRPRAASLVASVSCLVGFLLLTLAVRTGWGPLLDVDDAASRRLADATAGQPAASDFFRFVEVATGTVATAVATLVLVGVLLWKQHRRAAAYTLGVMLLTLGSTHVLKAVIGRLRPERQAEFGELTNGSFPSGHAAYVAGLGGVGIVLAAMLLRRAVARHVVTLVVLALAVLIGVDRLALGRHFPSDVVAGFLLGAGLVLLGTVLYSPLPRGHADAALPLVESVPAGTRDLHVILNPAKVEDPGQFRSIVSAMAAESGWSEPTWHYTTVADSGTGQADAAAVAGADLVMVAGGDGTVREVAAELAGTGIPLGVIPVGTGNLLARNLAIPLYTRSAIDVTLNGQDRAIDLVEVSGDGFADTTFMVMAGMGFDAAIMEGVNEDIKKRVGWLAYVLSALKSLMFPVVGVEVSVDDGPFTRHRARTVVVGNVGYLQAGMPLLPDATIDDGRLDVVLIHPKRFLSWLRVVWRVLAKRPRTDETLDRMTGRKVVIRAATATPRQLDGDSIGLGKELHMTCQHGRLLVRVPR